MTDTIIVLCEKHVYFLASKKKIDFIRQVDTGEMDSEIPPLKYLPRDKVCEGVDVNICVGVFHILISGNSHYKINLFTSFLPLG